MSNPSELVPSSGVITEFVLYVLLYVTYLGPWQPKLPQYVEPQYVEDWKKIQGEIDYDYVEFSPVESPEGEFGAQRWLEKNQDKNFHFDVIILVRLSLDDIEYEVQALLNCSIHLWEKDDEFVIDDCGGNKCRRSYDEDEDDDGEDNYLTHFNYPTRGKWCTSCHGEPLDRSILAFAVLQVHGGTHPDNDPFCYMKYVDKLTIVSQKTI